MTIFTVQHIKECWICRVSWTLIALQVSLFLFLFLMKEMTS